MTTATEMNTVEQQIEQQIRDAIKIEPSEPQDTILQVLTECDGQALTVRHAQKINDALAKVYNYDGHWANKVGIRKQYGMTAIAWDRGGDLDEGSLLLCWTEKNVVIEAGTIKERNPAYFSAKDERNALRKTVDVADVTALATQARIYAIAKQQLEAVLSRDCFDPDETTLQKIVGL